VTHGFDPHSRELALQTSASIVKEIAYMVFLSVMVCGGHPSGTTLCVSTTRFLIIVALGGRIIWPPRGSHRWPRFTFPLWIRNDSYYRLNSSPSSADYRFLAWDHRFVSSATFPVTVKASAASSYRIHTALIQRTDSRSRSSGVMLKNDRRFHCLNTLYQVEISKALSFVTLLTASSSWPRSSLDIRYTTFVKMQQANNRVFHEFLSQRSYKAPETIRIFFCRGIDIQSVNVVINFDFPRIAKRTCTPWTFWSLGGSGGEPSP
jgi:ATP-dependent RNA helicase DDX6/DHH1